MNEFVIDGKFPCLNDWIKEQNNSRFAGNLFKQTYQSYAEVCIIDQLRGIRITKPVILHYEWVEENKKRDLDNVAAFGHKVIQDALVACGVLRNDGWRHVIGFTDRFSVDPENPRIIVSIEEVDKSEQGKRKKADA